MKTGGIDFIYRIDMHYAELPYRFIDKLRPAYKLLNFAFSLLFFQLVSIS